MARAAFKRITDLGPERVAVLNSYLMQEKPVSEVADILRDDWGVFLEMTRERLMAMLSGYKARAIVPLQAQVAAKLSEEKTVKKLATLASELEGSLDAMRELEATIRIQMARVEKLALVEQGSDSVLKEQTRAITLLTGQLEKFANLQMDLGILKRVPAKLNISAEVSEEELKFVRQARLHGAETDVTMEAMRYLRGTGKLLTAGEMTVEAEIVPRPDNDEEDSKEEA